MLQAVMAELESKCSTSTAATDTANDHKLSAALEELEIVKTVLDEERYKYTCVKAELV